MGLIREPTKKAAEAACRHYTVFMLRIRTPIL